MGRVLIALTMVAVIRLQTSLLAPAEIGRLNIVLTVIGWFSLVLLNPAIMYMNRKMIGWHRRGTAMLNLTVLWKYMAGIALVSVVLLPFYKPFMHVDASLLWLILLIGGSVALTNGNSSCTSSINLLGHRAWFVSVSVMTLWFGLGFSTLLIAMFGNFAEYWLFGQVLAQGIMLAAAIVIIKRLTPAAALTSEAHDFSGTKILPFAWPLAVGVFFYWVQTQGYRFVFEYIHGLESLGYFVIGFGIGVNIMQAFEALFNQFYQPIFYAEITDVDDHCKAEAWGKYAAVFIPMVVVTAAYVASNSALVLKIVAAPKFQHLGQVVMWGALAESIRMIISMTSLVSHARLKMSPLILPGIIGSVFALLGIVLTAHRDPMTSAGVSMVVAWGVSFLFLYARMKKLLPISLPFKRIYFALLLAFPFVLFRFAYTPFFPAPGLIQSVCLLCVGGAYLLFTYFLLVRPYFDLSIAGLTGRGAQVTARNS